MFTLRSRLEKLNVIQPYNSIVPPRTDPEESAMMEAECEGKSPEGNRVANAQFSRERTHSEQLIICCCGVIIARATFFRSEAITSVKVNCLQLLQSP